MAIEPQSFRYEHDRATGVATVTLDRPERLNALTFEVYEELTRVFLALDTEPGVRSVLLTGSGRAFCSGGDVEDIIGALFARDYQGLLDFTRVTGALVLAILRCRRPVVRPRALRHGCWRTRRADRPGTARHAADARPRAARHGRHGAAADCRPENDCAHRPAQ